MNVLSPKTIYGTAWKAERTTQLVVNAFLQGFRAVDTACQPKHYREELVEIYIQTKFTPVGGQDLNKPIPYDPQDTIRDQITTSLAVSLLEAWRALIAAQDAGTVRKIGVSNVYDVQILAALGELRKVQVVQNRWYQGNKWDPAVWRYCKDNGIEYQSFWTLSGSPNLLAHQAVATMASRLDVTPAQVVFKLAQLHNIVPLTGTTNELHMQQDLAAEQITFGDEVKGEMRTIIELVWGK
ncbi:NADP-dependent oxidoreductase domain-containing protein [Melanogaster broomeanus]|nr:NADP-dependent oxidoreductase domain-containing protein [Melanogaster broomeanus]